MQQVLCLHGSQEGCLGGIERDLEGIADHLIHIAPVIPGNGPQDCLLAHKSLPHPFMVGFPPVRAAFDIGEQERHRPCREICLRIHANDYTMPVVKCSLRI